MNLLDRVRILMQLGRAVVAWKRHDTAVESPVPENPKFRSARDAAKLLRDGDVVADSGIGGQQRSSIVYWGA